MSIIDARALQINTVIEDAFNYRNFKRQAHFFRRWKGTVVFQQETHEIMAEKWFMAISFWEICRYRTYMCRWKLHHRYMQMPLIRHCFDAWRVEWEECGQVTHRLILALTFWSLKLIKKCFAQWRGRHLYLPSLLTNSTPNSMNNSMSRGMYAYAIMKWVLICHDEVEGGRVATVHDRVIDSGIPTRLLQCMRISDDKLYILEQASINTNIVCIKRAMCAWKQWTLFCRNLLHSGEYYIHDLMRKIYLLWWDLTVIQRTLKLKVYIYIKYVYTCMYFVI